MSRKELSSPWPAAQGVPPVRTSIGGSGSWAAGLTRPPSSGWRCKNSHSAPISIWSFLKCTDHSRASGSESGGSITNSVVEKGGKISAPVPKGDNKDAKCPPARGYHTKRHRAEFGLTSAAALPIVLLHFAKTEKRHEDTGAGALPGRRDPRGV